MKSQMVVQMRFQQVEKIQQTEKIQLVQKMFQLIVRRMMEQQWQQHLNCSGHLQAPSSMDPPATEQMEVPKLVAETTSWPLHFSAIQEPMAPANVGIIHKHQYPSMDMGSPSVLEHTWLGTLWQLIINSVSKTIDGSSLGNTWVDSIWIIFRS